MNLESPNNTESKIFQAHKVNVYKFSVILK